MNASSRLNGTNDAVCHLCEKAALIPFRILMGVTNKDVEFATQKTISIKRSRTTLCNKCFQNLLLVGSLLFQWGTKIEVRISAGAGARSNATGDVPSMNGVVDHFPNEDVKPMIYPGGAASREGQSAFREAGLHQGVKIESEATAESDDANDLGSKCDDEGEDEVDKDTNRSDKQTLSHITHQEEFVSPDQTKKSKSVSSPRKECGVLCSTCGLQCEDQRSLKRHREDEHPRTFPCKKCGAKFKHNYQMMRHARVHDPVPVRKEKCEKCGKWVSKLKSHLMKMHGAAGSKTFLCRFCTASFWDSNRLKEHERTHTKEKPYKCPQCERTFANASYLRLHASFHTGERNHACQFCGKRFARKSNQEIHEKHVHMKIFYSCPNHCGMQFRRKNKAMDHGAECKGILSNGLTD